ncbi:MAG TPA: DUF4430 domain-containing protein [Solirubrobacterales bacterium]|nr:DUF4430 domain-containing protein [Solirubrobacterales bacterium]
MKAAALVLAVAAIAATASGCGFGPGESSPGEATLRVTREFGTVPMVEANLEDPTESDTVVRFLDDVAEIETSYGDNFVDSIGGFAGSTAGGEDDWFFFVNGYWSDIGSGERPVLPGDRIWWDYRYWQTAYRVPAVVGSWPEPFLHGEHRDGAAAPPTIVQCLTAREDCDEVSGALAAAGVDARLVDLAEPREEPDALRVLVGPWDALRGDPAARAVESGPGESGVYATIGRCRDELALTIEDDHGRPAERLADAGLIAAVRRGDDQPTWLITGTDAPAAGVAAAALGSGVLRDRYAVAFGDGRVLPVPAAAAADEAEGGCP